MGRNSSKPDIDQLISRYNVRCRDQANNLTYLIDRRSNRNYMLKQVFANDEASIKNIESELIRKKQLHHEHVAQLKEYYINLSEQFCSRMYSSGALYEIPYRTLEDERNDRLRSKVPFDQNELWSILASSILGLAYLQRNFIQHQSVRTCNIYVQDSGTIKISDPFSKQLPTNYQLYRQSRTTPGLYLSPAELRSLREQHKYPMHNSYKSDVFSLGVVMLELAFLEPQSEMYFRNKGTLNQPCMKEQLERFEKRYGEEIRRIVGVMMDVNQNTRMDWVQLEGYVKRERGNGNTGSTGGSTGGSRRRASGENYTRGEGKPATADVITNKREQRSMENSSSSAVGLKTPEQGGFKREETVKTFQIPSNTNPVAITTHPTLNIQPQIPGSFMKPPVRAVRISEPPIRTVTQVSQLPIHNSRPPTQHHLSISPVHLPPHPITFQQQPQIQNIQVVRSTNPNFRSQEVNTSHNTPQMIQTVSGKGLSPLHINKDHQQVSQEVGQFMISHNSQQYVTTSQPQIVHMMPSAPARKMHFQPATHTQLSSTNHTPVKNLQSHAKFSKSPHQKTEKLHSGVSKFSIPVEPMEPSKLDRPCLVYGVPDQIYILKTKEDENVMDKPEQNNLRETEKFIQELKQHEGSFLSEHSRTYPAPPTVPSKQFQQPPPKTSKIPQSPSRNSRNSKPSSSTPRNSDSFIPVSPPAGGGAILGVPNSILSKPDSIQFVKEMYKQGSRYQGEKYKGMRHGKGKFFYDDGGMYDGSWNLNKMEGFGRLYYVDGRLAYQGYWVQDHFCGKGKLYNDNSVHIDRFDYRNFDDVEDYWNTYQGEFQGDLKHGYGVLVLENGERYEGLFKEDMAHGEGVFRGRDGVVKGIWSNNQLIKILH